MLARYPLFLIALVLLPACSALNNSNAQDRINEIETRLATLGGESKADVLEEMSLLGFDEPESIEQTDEGGERYIFHRNYLRKIMYDKVTLTFQEDRLASYNATVVR